MLRRAGEDSAMLGTIGKGNCLGDYMGRDKRKGRRSSNSHSHEYMPDKRSARPQLIKRLITD